LKKASSIPPRQQLYIGTAGYTPDPETGIVVVAAEHAAVLKSNGQVCDPDDEATTPKKGA
jgi:hypothetical protein